MVRRDDWTTPPRLFNYLNSKFKFETDAAADPNNALCKKFYSAEDSALTKIWGGSVFCNPPYSICEYFARHAIGLFEAGEADPFPPRLGVVFLLPVRSDRLWFQDILGKFKVTWITGRLHFGGSGKGAFMYNVLFYRGYDPRLILPDEISASLFNDNSKGRARS